MALEDDAVQRAILRMDANMVAGLRDLRATLLTLQQPAMGMVPPGGGLLAGKAIIPALGGGPAGASPEGAGDPRSTPRAQLEAGLPAELKNLATNLKQVFGPLTSSLSGLIGIFKQMPLGGSPRNTLGRRVKGLARRMTRRGMGRSIKTLAGFGRNVGRSAASYLSGRGGLRTPPITPLPPSLTPAPAAPPLPTPPAISAVANLPGTFQAIVGMTGGGTAPAAGAAGTAAAASTAAGAGGAAVAGTGAAATGGAAAAGAGMAALASNPVGWAVAAVGAIGTVTAALVKLPFALDSLGKSALEAQRNLAEVSGPMANVFAQSDLRDMLRDMQVGNRTAASTARLADARGDLADNLVDIKVLLTNIYNDALAKLVQGTNAVVEATDDWSYAAADLIRRANNDFLRQFFTELPLIVLRTRDEDASLSTGAHWLNEVTQRETQRLNAVVPIGQ